MSKAFKPILFPFREQPGKYFRVTSQLHLMLLANKFEAEKWGSTSLEREDYQVYLEILDRSVDQVLMQFNRQAAKEAADRRIARCMKPATDQLITETRNGIKIKMTQVIQLIQSKENKDKKVKQTTEPRLNQKAQKAKEAQTVPPGPQNSELLSEPLSTRDKSSNLQMESKVVARHSSSSCDLPFASISASSIGTSGRPKDYIFCESIPPKSSLNHSQPLNSVSLPGIGGAFFFATLCVGYRFLCQVFTNKKG